MTMLPATAPVVYHVRAADPSARIFEVTCRIDEPAVEGQLLSLPAWTPGSYLIRDYARHVTRLEAEARGESLTVRKLDKATWRVMHAAGPMLVHMSIHAADNSVRGARLDSHSAFFNAPCLLPRVHGKESLPSIVHIDPPETAGDRWQLATSMRRLTGAELDFGAFTADDYQDLIDHPVLMGELTRVRFEAAGVPHVLVIAGRHDADVTRLERDLARLCSWHIDFFGRPAPMDRYWFLLQARSGGTGGLEHRCSSALMCGPDHLPRPGVKPVSNGYRRFLGLVSHEYFHAWLAKRIRPLEFVETDLSSEAYTRQLWIFEGITSYYDDLALVRAGLISVEAYLEALGQNLTRLYRTPGRRQQTLEEASFDAWIKFYRPDENSANATVSYYLKGSLVALALDLDIRLRSAGRRSLDDVMRTLWLEYGLPPDAHGLPDGAFERLAAEASGLDLDDFFRQAIRSTVDPPLGILLAQFGIRLELRAAESADDRGGTAGKREPVERLWIGAAFRVADGRQCVTFVQDGGPARAAGLLPGDELVAIDGRRVTAENLDQLVNQMRPDETVEVHLLRGDELSVLSLRPEAAPKDTCYLVLDKEAPIDAVARRNAWLGK